MYRFPNKIRLSLIFLFSTVFLSEHIFAAKSGLTLDEAFSGAIMRSQDTAIQGFQINQKETQVDLSRSKMLPEILASHSYFRQQESSNSFGNSISPAKQETTKLTLNQSISSLLTNLSSIEASKMEVASQVASYNRTIEDLYLKVAEYYFSIKSLETEIKNISEEIRVNRNRVADLNRQIQSSRAKVSDLHTTQTQVHSLEAQREARLGTLTAYRTSFKILTGIDESTTLVSKPAVNDTNLPPLSDYLNIEQSPRIISSKFSLYAAQKNTIFIQNEFYPKVNISSNYYFNRPGINADSDWDVTLTVSLPLYSGGETKAKIESARANEKIDEAKLKKEKEGLIELISTTYEQYKSTQKQVMLLESTTKSSQLAYQSSQKDFRNGLINNSEVLKSIADYFGNRLNYEISKYSAELLRLKLNVYSQKQLMPYKRIINKDSHEKEK